MEFQGLQIEHFVHDSFKIKFQEKVIYLDPFELSAGQLEPADLILITHHHYDHCSVEDLKKIITSQTVVAAGGLSFKTLNELKVQEIIDVAPGQHLEIAGVKIQAVSAYNLDKWRSPGVAYHPKEENHVGYIIKVGETRIYHAGDTDNIPEMSQLRDIDIALLPVSGIYVMTWQEAAAAVKVIKPKLAIPMHYGSVVGSLADALRFKENAECRVEII